MKLDEGNEFVTLANLAGGAAAKRFQTELQNCLANVMDPNSRWQTTRRVRLEVSIKPNEERNAARVTIHCKSTLGPVKEVETTFFIGREAGVPVALERNPQQMTFNEVSGPRRVDTGTGEIFDD